ncbi:hypothetical protein PHYSODRAFT_302510 [Phytophthora sojae]|uniref:Uncharacterized protein n=1 Tax=Phytophthora sojae (strain P6497) TaxID=1094619 RepID=G4ZQS9_PHYSP|nr:hypothetical protein PHYSODRAFT_302510 [Phytophthora sojae]EGZ16180.1 hypothetical protein PHYSODRAFT_302510 [Phytophthora sojae]|eukprot:XP_009529929.1 hypothetical protein PHYSODRAFT_302510 [Phytophthora sojae]
MDTVLGGKPISCGGGGSARAPCFQEARGPQVSLLYAAPPPFIGYGLPQICSRCKMKGVRSISSTIVHWPVRCSTNTAMAFTRYTCTASMMLAALLHRDVILARAAVKPFTEPSRVQCFRGPHTTPRLDDNRRPHFLVIMRCERARRGEVDIVLLSLVVSARGSKGCQACHPLKRERDTNTVRVTVALAGELWLPAFPMDFVGMAPLGPGPDPPAVHHQVVRDCRARCLPQRVQTNPRGGGGIDEQLRAHCPLVGPDTLARARPALAIFSSSGGGGRRCGLSGASCMLDPTTYICFALSQRFFFAPAESVSSQVADQHGDLYTYCNNMVLTMTERCLPAIEHSSPPSFVGGTCIGYRMIYKSPAAKKAGLRVRLQAGGNQAARGKFKSSFERGFPGKLDRVSVGLRKFVQVHAARKMLDAAKWRAQAGTTAS